MTRPRRRRTAPGRILAAAVTLLAAVLGAALYAARSHVPATPYRTRPVTSSTSAPTSRTSAVPRLPSSSGTGAQIAAARVMLARLPVIRHRPYRPGYQRGCGPGQACSFGPAWTDDTTAAGGHNGCDTRNDVLRHDLQSVTLRPGSRCVVAAGVLDDPYTGVRIPFRRGPGSGQVQIDHLVPLALAWDLGAWRWAARERAAYANDERLVLLAVSGPANEAKSDSGPAGWMPPDRASWCGYDARFVAILAHYRLAVTAADKRAVAGVLAACPSATAALPDSGLESPR